MNEIGVTMVRFLNGLKEEFIAKKVAQETRTKQREYDNSLAKSKQSTSQHSESEKEKLDKAIAKAIEKFSPEADSKYELKNWLNKAASKAKPNITTHVAKFTNPKISNVTSFAFYGNNALDGYVKTGNVNLTIKVDASGDAATNTLIIELYLLLDSRLSDGTHFISKFENNDTGLLAVLKKNDIQPEAFIHKCISIYRGSGESDQTHDSVRQIYFPVSPDYYNLLSVLTPSMLLFEVKNRVDVYRRWIDGESIKAVRKENKFDPEGYDEIFGLTEIGFSHTEFTKMGNVSYLNVKNKGIAYLLPSLPPMLKKRETQLPARDFFRNSIREFQFKESFQSLHKLIITDVNNVRVRGGINNILKFIIDQVLQAAFKIRTMEIGWSNAEHYQTLPKSQRIWLDNFYFEQRENDDGWIDEIASSLARWVLYAYESSLKSDGIKLGDYGFDHIRTFTEEAISSDKEFFK